MTLGKMPSEVTWKRRCLFQMDGRYYDRVHCAECAVGNIGTCGWLLYRQVAPIHVCFARVHGRQVASPHYFTAAAAGTTGGMTICVRFS